MPTLRFVPGFSPPQSHQRPVRSQHRIALRLLKLRRVGILHAHHVFPRWTVGMKNAHPTVCTGFLDSTISPADHLLPAPLFDCSDWGSELFGYAPVFADS